jgi:hypothetical protein
MNSDKEFRTNGDLMKLIYSATLILALTSCSSSKSLLEIVGIERMEIDQESYEKPEFFIGEYNVKKGRSIASVKITNKPGLVVDESLSNRQLYFLSSFSQYKTMRNILKKEDAVASCPSFHNLLLKYEEVESDSHKNYSLDLDFEQVKENQRNLTYFPILAVPYSESKDLYSVLVDNKWKDSAYHVETALNHYFKTSESEIVELCDKGVSPGYYVYENLVTYFKKDQKFHRTRDGLKALLKVPVLANMVILDNLNRKDYHFKEIKVFDKWLLTRTNADWFEHFLKNLKEKRESRISTNFVR